MMPSKIIDTKFTDALNERYLAYALSTIMSRSLPDVRDGLKPVHRRILFAMLQLKMDPKAAYKKCARVVGDVIGKYHPHGDTAVYDALVRLAQDFTIRYPLIEGQGNFGSIDGDNAAAMRYTESRLTEVSLYLLRNLEENTVNFKSTYDEQDNEPCLLPAMFPNLLANGTEGIAVGMATSIPPHNIAELCEASLKLLSKPDLSVADLLEYIQGPDLPTGGIINETKENIIKTYETGKGNFKVRAVWHKEDLPRNNYQIIITEIPYQVQKSRLIEKIAELYKDKKLPLIDNFYDDSAETISLVIKPKNSNIAPEAIMESLFKLTDLEYRVSFNMNVLDSNTIPRVMSLKEILEEFLKHREVIITKRSLYRLDKINHRLEILAGFLIAYLNLDEIIRIIRYEDEPKEMLMQSFSLSEIQAEAILNMKLKSLRRLEEETIRTEHSNLSATKAELEDILANPASLRKVIRSELTEVKNKFSSKTKIGARKTVIENTALPPSQNINIEDYIAKEPITLICSQLGWIRALKGHNASLEKLRYKDNDGPRFIIELFTTDKILVFTQTGKFYTLSANSLNITRGDGDPINLLLDLDKDEHIINIQLYHPQQKILLATRNGKGFVVESNEVLAQTKLGKKVMNVAEGDGAIICKPIDPSHDLVAILGSNRKLLIFKTDELPEMKRGQGVQLQKYQDAKLSALKLFSSEEGLSWTYLSQQRREKRLTPWIAKRGKSGKIPPAGLAKNNKFD
ncbi:MAG: DNA topoisomerase IV subunit A [Rickettsiales bacterium]|nr:DNA topoisomerase IV subunit A [Rickettsiales bacterium]